MGLQIHIYAHMPAAYPEQSPAFCGRCFTSSPCAWRRTRREQEANTTHRALLRAATSPPTTARIQRGGERGGERERERESECVSAGRRKSPLSRGVVGRFKQPPHCGQRDGGRQTERHRERGREQRAREREREKTEREKGERGGERVGGRNSLQVKHNSLSLFLSLSLSLSHTHTHTHTHEQVHT